MNALNDDDVVSMTRDESLTNERASRVEDVLYEIEELLSSSQLPCQGWVGDGVACEVLKAEGGGWQKGKVRILFSLEFIPDKPPLTKAVDPNSPLDDLRAQIENI